MKTTAKKHSPSTRVLDRSWHRGPARWLGGAVLSLGTLAGAHGAIVGFNFTDLNATFDFGTPVNFTLSDISIGNTNGTVTTPVNITSASSGYTIPAADTGGAAGTPSGGGNVGNAVKIGALDTNTSSYYQITFTPSAGFLLQITNFDFAARSTSTGPINYSLRSSLDNYASSVLDATGTNAGTYSFKDNLDFSLSGTANTALTLRLYTYGGAGNAGASTENNRLDDIYISLTATNGGGGGTAGNFFGTTGQGVNGASTVFDATTLDFSSKSDGTGTVQVYDPAQTAVFGGTAGAVTVGTVTANGGLQFTKTGYSLSGGDLTLATIPTIEVTTAGDIATINSTISGSAGLTKAGAGTLVLTGTNDYTGTTTISAGILNFTVDANLGAGFGPIALAGGTLQANGDVDLGPRTLSGSGGIDVAAGKLLQFFGTLNAGTLTFASAGTFSLQGSTGNAVTGLTFNAAGTLTGNALTLGGNITTAQTAGTATIANALALGTVARTITTGDGSADVDLLISGDITGAARINKRGDGTLRLKGNNAGYTGGVGLGAAPTSTLAALPGGRILINSKNDLGTLPFQLNAGTVEAQVPLTGADAIPVAISFGTSPAFPGVFSGSDMEFSGGISLFKPTGVTTGFAHRITVNNHLTFTGSFGTSTGSGGTIPEFDIDGPAGASLTLANASNPVTEGFVVTGPDLLVSGSLSADFVTVKSGALKAGNGASFHTLFIGEGVGSDDARLSSVSTTPGLVPVSAGLTLGSDAVLQIRIDTDLALSDSFAVLGGITLGNGGAGLPLLTLVSIGNTPLPMGLEFKILDEQDTTTSTGIFRGLSDLARITLGNNIFEIDYNAGTDVNDVILRVVPEPTSLVLLSASGLLLGLSRSRRPARSA